MLVYIAILTPVLLLFCGLAVDVGQLELQRLQMQSASDAAALGAAQELERNGASGNWVSYGQSDSSSNGFTNGSANTTVAVQQQPTYGAYAGFYDAVQTTITKQVPLSFMGLINLHTSTVTVQSTALVTPCAYISGATGAASPALSISGGSGFSSDCPWYINGSTSMDSSSSFSALAENVTGPAGASNWTVASGSAPRYSARAMSDPLASITQPTVGACTATNKSMTGDTALTPGTYCGTFSADCRGYQNNNNRQCVLTVQPGLYIFTGNVTMNYAAFYGTGATLYFTRNGVNTSSTGNISFTNYAAVYLTAPTDASNGGIPGVVMMNDRNWTRTSAQDFKWTSAYLYAEGVVYLTGTGASMQGSLVSYQSRYLAFDVDNLAVSGSTFNTRNDFSEVNGGSPFQPQGGLVQ